MLTTLENILKMRNGKKKEIEKRLKGMNTKAEVVIFAYEDKHASDTFKHVKSILTEHIDNIIVISAIDELRRKIQAVKSNLIVMFVDDFDENDERVEFIQHHAGIDATIIAVTSNKHDSYDNFYLAGTRNTISEYVSLNTLVAIISSALISSLLQQVAEKEYLFDKMLNDSMLHKISTAINNIEQAKRILENGGSDSPRNPDAGGCVDGGKNDRHDIGVVCPAERSCCSVG